MMNYRYQKVQLSLTEYIRTVLVLEDGPGQKSPGLPLFTSGTPALLCRTRKISPGAENVLQLTLYGRSAPPDCWQIPEDETLIAYFFRPFSLPCLFNLPAALLAGDPVSLDVWNAPVAYALKTQLVCCESTAEKIAALDNMLCRQAGLQQKEWAIVRYATDEILLHADKEILPEILKALNLHERTFQRIFKKFVGITPTQYRRICQFKASLDQLKSGQFARLTDVAYDTGFADQSHFIRSFKEFTHVTPRAYLKQGLKKREE